MPEPSYVDPLIPLQESTPEELTRLSANIAVLTNLIEDSEHRGLGHLAAMFLRSRNNKVEQALSRIARSK